ncbi:MAG: preprotein translocase subunit YajC [Acidimicrobiales bacterium]|jgi:preprotein translocase subunit YajC
MELIPFVLLLAVMWFLLIRPQQARLRKQRELVASIEVGDEVLTAGGIIGTVRVLTDDELRLEVGPGVEMRMLRAAVTRRLDDDAGVAEAEVEPPDDGDVAGPEQER